jgi:peptide/nickel transport system permease protein
LKRYLLRRVSQSLPVLLMVVLLGFVLVRMMPGDPAQVALGPKASKQELEDEARRQGLDRPLPVQMLLFAKRMVTLDLPRSAQGDLPIGRRIADAFVVTVKLGLGALLVAVSAGLLMALLSARWPRGAIDWGARVGAVSGVSIPVFWLGMLLLALFSEKLGWLPSAGYQPGQLSCLVLPCLALGLIYSASLARVSRAALLEELSKPYCTTARAKGLSKWGVLIRHALPNAMIPMVTVIGSQLAGLLAGAVLTETVFQLPGLGKLIVEAIKAQDRYMVVTALLLVAVVFVMVNLALDFVYAWLDPRVRYGSQG